MLQEHGPACALVCAHLCRCQWVGEWRVEDSERRGLCVPLLINTMWSSKQRRTAAELPGRDFEHKSTAHNWSELVLGTARVITFEGLHFRAETHFRSNPLSATTLIGETKGLLRTQGVLAHAFACFELELLLCCQGSFPCVLTWFSLRHLWLY